MKTLAVILALSLPVGAASSLTNGAAATDNVDYGTAVVSNAATYTIFQWLYPTAFAGSRQTLSTFQSNLGWLVRIAGTNSLQVLVFNTVAGNYAAYTNSLTNAMGLNSWTFVMITVDINAVTPDRVRIYYGIGNDPLTEGAYTQQTGSGSPSNPTGNNFIVGNRVASSLAFQGDIGPTAYVEKLLTVEDGESFRRNPRKYWNETKLLTYPGFTNTGPQPDISGNGNNGTVTGATASLNGPPILIGGGPI